MKKTIIRIAALAITVCTITTACSKDDTNSIKTVSILANETPVIDKDFWPDSALVKGDDDYYYNLYNQRTDLDRIDSLLLITMAPTNIVDSLPNNFTVLYPLDTPNPGSIRVVVIFSDMDRATAIETLKRIRGIYAIEPVYNDNGIRPSLEYFSVEMNKLDDTISLMEFAEAIHCDIDIHCYQFAWQCGRYWITFHMNHSLYNSIAASNLLFESGMIKSVFDIGLVPRAMTDK